MRKTVLQKKRNDPFNRMTLQLLLDLLSTRHLGLTSEHLGISAATASRKLDAMREAFDDPLFIVSGRGLVPTPFMQSLEADLKQADLSLDRLFAPKEFDPASAKIIFRVAVRGLVEASLLGFLLATLRREAPYCRLSHTCRTGDSFEKLLAGQLDFVVSTDVNVPHMCRYMPIFPIELGILTSKHHPLFETFKGAAPTVEALNHYDRIAIHVSKTGHQTFDSRVVGLDPKRLIMTTNEPLAALEIAQQSDFIVIAPKVGTSSTSNASGVVWMPLPEELQVDDEHSAVLVWSEENHQNPAHIWLRSLIRTWSNGCK